MYSAEQREYAALASSAITRSSLRTTDTRARTPMADRAA
jgi:hypothetical protein